MTKISIVKKRDTLGGRSRITIQVNLDLKLKGCRWGLALPRVEDNFLLTQKMGGYL